MGITEWLALISLGVVLIGSIIKAMNDKTELTTKLAALEKWKDKMEESDMISGQQYDKNRSECRIEVYRDINRIERKADDFFRAVEEQNKRINGIDLNVAKILTILESTKKEGNGW